MIKLIKLSQNEKVTHCNHCGAEMIFNKEDVINTYTSWVETTDYNEIRFKTSYIICPVCQRKLILIAAASQLREKGSKLYDND